LNSNERIDVPMKYIATGYGLPYNFSLYSLTYCDRMPERRNSGIGSGVDFLGKVLLRRLHDHS
jgi:hypothetical protein